MTKQENWHYVLHRCLKIEPYYLTTAKIVIVKSTECPGLLFVANSIVAERYVKLSTAFCSAFPGVTYHAKNAKRKLLKMPIAALRVGTAASGMYIMCVSF